MYYFMAIFFPHPPSSSMEYSHTFANTGNSTYAGATAAITANIVLVAYVVVAMREDQADKTEAIEKRKLRKDE